MLNAAQLGFKADDPNYDNSTVLNGLPAHLSGSIPMIRTIFFPCGNYYFNTQPNILTEKLNFIGEGINGTAFIRNYDEPTIERGLLDCQATCKIEGISFHAADGCNGGSAITFRGRPASASVARDLYISAQGSGTWACGVTLWGATEELGVRSVMLENIEIFSCTSHLFWLINARGLTAIGLNGYPTGSGTVSHATVQHGGANNWRPSTIYINTRYLTQLYAYNTDNLTLAGINTSMLTASGCVNARKV